MSALLHVARSRCGSAQPVRVTHNFTSPVETTEVTVFACGMNNNRVFILYPVSLQSRSLQESTLASSNTRATNMGNTFLHTRYYCKFGVVFPGVLLAASHSQGTNNNAIGIRESIAARNTLGKLINRINCSRRTRPSRDSETLECTVLDFWNLLMTSPEEVGQSPINR
jgi:hypothetical protein